MSIPRSCHVDQIQSQEMGPSYFQNSNIFYFQAIMKRQRVRIAVLCSNHAFIHPWQAPSWNQLHSVTVPIGAQSWPRAIHLGIDFNALSSNLSELFLSWDDKLCSLSELATACVISWLNVFKFGLMKTNASVKLSYICNCLARNLRQQSELPTIGGRTDPTWTQTIAKTIFPKACSKSISCKSMLPQACSITSAAGLFKPHLCRSW